MNPNWLWTAVVIAPTGEAIGGTEAQTQVGAVKALLGQRNPEYLKYLWDIALSQGYKIKWAKRTPEPKVKNPAGTITIGRGSRWGASLA